MPEWDGREDADNTPRAEGSDSGLTTEVADAEVVEPADIEVGPDLDGGPDVDVGPDVEVGDDLPAEVGTEAELKDPAPTLERPSESSEREDLYATTESMAERADDFELDDRTLPPEYYDDSESNKEPTDTPKAGEPEGLEPLGLESRGPSPEFEADLDAFSEKAQVPAEQGDAATDMDQPDDIEAADIDDGETADVEDGATADVEDPEDLNVHADSAAAADVVEPTAAFAETVNAAPDDPANDHSYQESTDRGLEPADDPNQAEQGRAELADDQDRALERLGRGETVPGGMAFYEPGDSTLDAAKALPPVEGHRTYDLHGTPSEVSVAGERVGAKEFADVVRADPGWAGQPVYLFSCETGKQPDRGGDPFGQELADELGVPVQAPTELAWSDGAGTVEVTAGGYDEYGDFRPCPPAGEFRTFHPRGRAVR